VLNITEAATRCAMPATEDRSMAYGLVPSGLTAAHGSGAAAYMAFNTRNDAQGGASAWSPPV
jgi:hypothetical protein